jgi:K+-sensing histidine kinase KdpD
VAARGYLIGAIALTACTVLSMASTVLLHAAAFIMVFPLTVLFVTIRFGLGPALFTAVLGVLVFDFVYVPPPLAFALPDLKSGLTLSVMVLVAAAASSMAEQMRRQTERAKLQAEIERLRNALLSALSHDLRTPISTLIGASTALCEGNLAPAEQREFSSIVATEASRLNRLVTNLLELTRLESGRVSPRPSPHAIDEVIGSSLRRLEVELAGRHVRTEVPESTPFVPFDPVRRGCRIFRQARCPG